MDRKRPSPVQETFIVRLWQRESAPADWLGQVQHVRSGETAVVHNLDEITAVIKRIYDEKTNLASNHPHPLVSVQK